MQGDLNLMGCIDRRKVDLDARAIAACDTEQAAIRLCMRWHRSHLPQEDIAEAIGLKPHVLSKMANTDHYERRGRHKGCRYMSRTLQIALQRECGNNAIDQWAEMYEMGKLYCQRPLDEQEAELLERLAEIQAKKNAS